MDLILAQCVTCRTFLVDYRGRVICATCIWRRLEEIADGYVETKMLWIDHGGEGGYA